MIREIDRAMFDYLPRYYEDIRESRAIVNAQAIAYTQFNTDIADLLNQFYLDTCTWGLPYWERLVGMVDRLNLTVWDALIQRGIMFNDVEGITWDSFENAFVPDEEARRSEIKARMRGFGTITKEKLAEICSAFAGGAVNVTQTPANYLITIQFVDTAGVPTSVDTLQAVVRELLPAHLAVEYIYRYLRWVELDNFAMTWSVLDAKEYTWDEWEVAVNGN